MSDYVTVITASFPPHTKMAKKLSLEGVGATAKIKKSGYDKTSHFNVGCQKVTDIVDLSKLLYDLSEQNNAAVIRGKPLHSMINVRRRIHGEETAFVMDMEGHHWFCIDFDDIPLPMLIDENDDPQIMLGFLVRLLPQTFHNASFYYQWSAGHGLNGATTLNAHCWFWNAVKHTDTQFEEWAKWWNATQDDKIIDVSLFRTVQCNYTSNPILDYIDDPLKYPRTGFHIGAKNEVSIKIPDKKWDRFVAELEKEQYSAMIDYGIRDSSMPLQQQDSDRYLHYLARIGDGPDHDGFHDPITKACWYWARSNPEKFDIDFKEALRTIIHDARNDKNRNLAHYLSDYYIDMSINGARAKTTRYTPHSEFKVFKNTQKNYSQIMRTLKA